MCNLVDSKNVIFSFLALVVLSGCATNYDLDPVDYDRSSFPLFAPVSIIIDDGTMNSGNAWAYDVEIYEQLAESELFEAISGFGVNQKLVIWRSTKGNNNIVPFFISAATLFLLPIPNDTDHFLKAHVYLGGKLVKEYDYSVNETWFKPPITEFTVRGARDAITIMISHLIDDLVSDQPFYKSENAGLKKGSATGKGEGVKEF